MRSVITEFHQAWRGLLRRPGFLVLASVTLALRFAVHVAGEPGTHVPAILDAVGDVAPGQPVANVATVDDLVRDSTGGTRLSLLLIGTFASLSLALSVVGLYAVVAVAAGHRRREFGVRSALGSSRGRLFGLVLGDGLRQVLTGLAIGLLLAVAAGRGLASVVIGLGNIDPLVWLVVSLVPVAATLAACLLPALRDARVAPGAVLRSE